MTAFAADPAALSYFQNLFASIAEEMEVVRVLVVRGVDPNCRGGQALQWASGSGHEETARVLREAMEL